MEHLIPVKSKIQSMFQGRDKKAIQVDGFRGLELYRKEEYKRLPL
jgi:hypothetical protein